MPRGVVVVVVVAAAAAAAAAAAVSFRDCIFLNQSKDLLWDAMSRTNKELLAAELRSILSYCADVSLCVSVTIIVTVKKKTKEPKVKHSLSRPVIGPEES